MDFLSCLGDSSLISKSHLTTTKIWVTGGGAQGDAADASVFGLGFSSGQPQPPKHPSPS